MWLFGHGAFLYLKFRWLHVLSLHQVKTYRRDADHSGKFLPPIRKKLLDFFGAIFFHTSLCPRGDSDGIKKLTWYKSKHREWKPALIRIVRGSLLPTSQVSQTSPNTSLLNSPGYRARFSFALSALPEFRYCSLWLSSLHGLHFKNANAAALMQRFTVLSIFLRTAESGRVTFCHYQAFLFIIIAARFADLSSPRTSTASVKNSWKSLFITTHIRTLILIGRKRDHKT